MKKFTDDELLNKRLEKDMISIQKERAKIGKYIYELGIELLPDEDIFSRNEEALKKMNAGWIDNDEIFICLTLYLSGEYDE
jgi:hypothetical protein